MCFGERVESDGNVMLCKSEKRGKCIVAEKDFKKGETVFRSPITVFKDWETVERSELKENYYVYDEKMERCCFVEGIASFVNHDKNPNASENFDYNNKLFICKAEKDIKKNEEVLVEFNAVWIDDQSVEALRIS